MNWSLQCITKSFDIAYFFILQLCTPMFWKCALGSKVKVTWQWLLGTLFHVSIVHTVLLVFIGTLKLSLLWNDLRKGSLFKKKTLPHCCQVSRVACLFCSIIIIDQWKASRCCITVSINRKIMTSFPHLCIIMSSVDKLWQSWSLQLFTGIFSYFKIAIIRHEIGQ